MRHFANNKGKHRDLAKSFQWSSGSRRPFDSPGGLEKVLLGCFKVALQMDMQKSLLLIPSDACLSATSRERACLSCVYVCVYMCVCIDSGSHTWSRHTLGVFFCKSNSQKMWFTLIILGLLLHAIELNKSFQTNSHRFSDCPLGENPSRLRGCVCCASTLIVLININVFFIR